MLQWSNFTKINTKHVQMFQYTINACSDYNTWKMAEKDDAEEQEER